CGNIQILKEGTSYIHINWTQFKRIRQVIETAVKTKSVDKLYFLIRPRACICLRTDVHFNIIIYAKAHPTKSSGRKSIIYISCELVHVLEMAFFGILNILIITR